MTSLPHADATKSYEDFGKYNLPNQLSGAVVSISIDPRSERTRPGKEPNYFIELKLYNSKHMVINNPYKDSKWKKLNFFYIKCAAVYRMQN